MSRNYRDFSEACIDAIKDSPIPKPFARWSALSAVAGARVEEYGILWLTMTYVQTYL